MPSKIQRELAFLLTGRDVSASKSMRGVRGEIRALERHSGKAFRNISQNMERGLVLGATAAAGAIGYSVKAAIDWESAFAGVRKTVEGTPAELDAIAAGIRSMSKEMPVSAIELAAIAESAGALGIARADILSFTRTVAMLGATTNVSSDEAATALGQLQNVLGLTGADFGSFAAALVDLGNKGASTEAQILEIARRAGGSASLVGVAKDEVLGWAAAAANLGMQEEIAGTSLQRFFQVTLSATGTGGAKLKALAGVAGMAAAQFRKGFGKDATGALSAFVRGLGKLPKKERLAVVQQVFGKSTGLTRLILGLADSFDRNLNPALHNSTTAWADGTAASAEYQKRVETTGAQLEILRNSVTDAAVTIGTQLLPVMNELAKEGVSWITDHQAEIAAFGRDLADNIREAVDWARQLDWDAIASTLKAGAGVAKGIVDAFVSAPPWVQQFLAAGFVANKFTGGVIGDVIGELGKGLIKGILGINAGVVNVNAGVVNGGGLPTTGGGPSGGSSGSRPSLPTSGVVVPAIGASGNGIPIAEIKDYFDQNIRPGLVERGRITGSPSGPGPVKEIGKLQVRIEAGNRLEERGFTSTRTGLAQLGRTTATTGSQSLAAFRAAERASANGLANAAAAARVAGTVTAIANAVAATRIVSAIERNRPVVRVAVTANSVTSARTQASRVGRTSSRNGDVPT